MPGFIDAETAYKAWMTRQLDGAFIEGDYAKRRKKMAKDAFGFLRGTYWRWSETAPDFSAEARVLAVGDIHVENFGLWRAAQGGLAFGVNDYDEAAEMPWPHDLVRLVTSAVLGAAANQVPVDAGAVAAPVLAGYAAGMAAPGPVLVDAAAPPWAPLLAPGDADRAEFWKEEMKEEKNRQVTPPDAIRAMLVAALPAAAQGGFYARSAGNGSLGRPRVAVIERDGPTPVAVWEVKVLLPSTWTLRSDEAPLRNRTAEAAAGAHRAGNPHVDVRDRLVLRRLTPEINKIEFPKAMTAGTPALPVDPVVLAAMGHDLAAIHAATGGAAAAIRRAIEADRGRPDWLAAAAATMADRTLADYRAFTQPPAPS